MRKLSRLASLSTFLLVASCDSFLDSPPEGVLTPESFYTSPADAVAAVNGIYEQVMWTYWIDFWYLSDLPTDDIIVAPTAGPDMQRLSTYTFNATEGAVGGMWGNSYRTINRANTALDRIPAITMDETLQSRLLAEARFFRALSYFNLVRFYGDVPIFTAPISGTPAAVRAPVADVYALIESDLEASIPDLPLSYGAADRGRVTRGAAQTLLAKVHLTQEEWDAAAQHADDVIQSDEYELLDDWQAVFHVATEIENDESILEMNYDPVLTAGSIHTLFSLPAGVPGGDAYGLMEASPSLISIYAPQDERGLGGTYVEEGFVDAAGRTWNWENPSGPAFLKYLDQTSTQNMQTRAWMAQSNNWYVLRYADVLLMYAEAVNEGGTQGSLTKEAALNLVRERSGLTPVGALSTEAFRDSVRVERRREFVYEGHRWFDLVRWGLLDEAIQAKTGTTPPSDLMPIPQGEIDSETGLVQNPGW